MFTTIMYGFINEVTRQPATAEIPLNARRRGRLGHPVRRSRTVSRPVLKATQPQPKRPGAYGVFADSFKRAAGFN